MQFKKNQAYYIRAYDHAVGTKELLTVEVIGWVIDQNPLSVTMTYWLSNSKDPEVRKDNIEPFVILKSAIIKKKALPLVPIAVH